MADFNLDLERSFKYVGSLAAEANRNKIAVMQLSQKPDDANIKIKELEKELEKLKHIRDLIDR